MKYTREERLQIGRRIWAREINCAEAALEYDIDMYTARGYMRLYKAFLKQEGESGRASATGAQKNSGQPARHADRYETMTRAELIAELKSLRGES